MQPVKNVIDAARNVAKAHLAMKAAHRDEVSPRVMQGKKKALFDALEKLTESLVVFEKELDAAKKAGSKPGSRFDWHGFFRAADGFLGLVAKAKEGKLGAKDVKEYIDVEVMSVTEKRR